MTTLNETQVPSLKINRVTKTQLEQATSLSPNQLYLEDPEFVGGKLLETTSDGGIVESSQTIPTKTSDLTNDSGFITSSALTGYATETWVGQQGYITGITSAMVTTALGYSPVNPTALATVATSGSYNDLSNKPTIPTVNNPTITLTQGGTTKGSFTLNQSSGATIALDAGGSVKTHDLFDNKWTDHLLNDQSWLRADTFSWHPATTQYGTYLEAYNHLVDDYTNGTSQTETVGSYTITYYLATDGHKICLPDQEATAANIYNESGVAWYYILDTANQRFKLPRENPAREELIQVVRAKGNGMTLGVTKDNTTINTLIGSYGNWSGASGTNLFVDNYNSQIGGASSHTNAQGALGITTDPTKSGIISDMTDSTSVYKGKQCLYFYVGQFSQSATEQTAGLNSELFNGKADIEALNNKIQLVSTLPASQTNGVLYVIPE